LRQDQFLGFPLSLYVVEFSTVSRNKKNYEDNLLIGIRSFFSLSFIFMLLRFLLCSKDCYALQEFSKIMTKEEPMD